MTITTLYISHAFFVDLLLAITTTSISYISTSLLKLPAVITLLVTPQFATLSIFLTLLDKTLDITSLKLLILALADISTIISLTTLFVFSSIL